MRSARRSSPVRWGPSAATVAALAVLGATIAYWGLQLLTPPAVIAPAGSLIDTASMPDIAPAQRLFGGGRGGDADEPGAFSPAPDIRVLGVAASTMRASAVLAIGSDIPRAWAVGDWIDDHLRLIAVEEDRIVLERDGERIELSPPARPSASLLSSAVADTAADTAAETTTAGRRP